VFINGRTNRLASAPRVSPILWSRARESSRKGVEEPSLAGLYDTNMMHPILHASSRLAFAAIAVAPASARIVVQRIFLLIPAHLWVFQRFGVRKRGTEKTALATKYQSPEKERSLGTSARFSTERT
jgi:hypothetical protein